MTAGPPPLAHLPLLPTTVVGSHGIPGWFHVARQAVARGEFGATDLEELYADATRLAIQDMEQAGVDVISDGEMRRLHFVQDFYGRLAGLQPLGAARKLGSAGYDMVPQYRAVERITLRAQCEQEDPSPPARGNPGSGQALGSLPAAGLGIVEEYTFARTLTERPLKVTCPGAADVRAANPARRRPVRGSV